MQLNLDRVIMLAFCFMFFFMAYATARILSPKIMKEAHFKTLGFNAMATCYITFGVASFFSAPLVQKLGDKWAMFMGTVCLGTYSGVFILPLELNEDSSQTLH
jgi:MFS family permease